MEFPASTLCASDWYSNCSNNMFSCGEITNVGYPFWGAARPEACGNPQLKLTCSKRNLTVKVAIGISAVVAGIILISIVAFYKFKRECLSFWQWSYGRMTRNEQKVEEFIRNYGSLAPKQYSYSFVKKVTNSFKNKIGQGGYGVVYKGMLPDGRQVAVKVLSESKGNGEDFINEIASISRTSHVNVVALLGFCYEKKKRALIYEYMSNGSLDKFIYTRGLSSENGPLKWKTRNEIVVGIARGLEYLHRGCNTRILHFDIKPHNILLDDNLCPKISDFGLAKLCERKDSVVTTMNARGTAGYIAPEVHCRNIGRVSHKSDVYSYGMMVLEIVAGRKNIDAEVSHTSEIYFPHYVYEHLEGGKDLRLDGITNEEEEEIARKMILISLWCIQTIPSNRPSMTKVVEMLEGSLYYDSVSLVCPGPTIIIRESVYTRMKLEDEADREQEPEIEQSYES
nr:LEAF RUST 10 DISEASE-RESISTANCE LOCUS RECEPTOR-LIKE PROTEIN KINASE-like 2.4 [Quercus suber]